MSKRNFFSKPANIIFLLGVIIALIIIVLKFTNIINPYYEKIIISVCINIILALSLNIVLGITGQLSLGHAAFMGIGAYISGILSLKFGIPIYFSIFISGFVAMIFGFLIGLPTLRLKGDYLAIATLGFGEIVRVIIENIDYLGGARGLYGIPRQTNLVFSLIMVFVVTIFMVNICKSSFGRSLMSVREDELAAQSMGVNVTSSKIKAFMIGAFFAGVAGAMFANQVSFINPSNFTFLKSVDIVSYVVLGGMGSITGSFIGSIVLTVLPELLSSLIKFRNIIIPIILIGLMLFRRQGIMGRFELSDLIMKIKNGKKEGK